MTAYSRAYTNRKKGKKKTAEGQMKERESGLKTTSNANHLNLTLTKEELHCIAIRKILTFIIMKGSVSFVFGILIFLGDALINLIDILLGKKMTPTTVQTVKQRNTATERYSTLKGKQTRHFMAF